MKGSHDGKYPLIAVPIKSRDCMARFSVKFSGKVVSNFVTPDIRFGENVWRLCFCKETLQLMALVENSHDKRLVNEAKDFKYTPDTWYHMMWELKGAEVVVQIAGGPTLYAKHPASAKVEAHRSSPFGIAGINKGTVEVDDVVFYSTKPEATQPGWEAMRKKLDTFKPVTPETKGNEK